MTQFFKCFSIVLLGLSLTVMGCTDTEDYDDADDADGTMTNTEGQMDDDMNHGDDLDHDGMMNAKMLIATVHPTQNSEVEGTVTFKKVAEGVRVSGDLTGLSQGKHGFHIHQYGDCSAADGTSAGGHYNPAGNDHAARTDSVRHMGDMGNIQAGGNGNATVNYVDSVINLHDIIGRAVVIHGGQDDFSSQPSGAAGPRMACGIIGMANADAMMNDNMENENMQSDN